MKRVRGERKECVESGEKELMHSGEPELQRKKNFIVNFPQGEKICVGEMQKPE